MKFSGRFVVLCLLSVSSISFANTEKTVTFSGGTAVAFAAQLADMGAPIKNSDKNTLKNILNKPCVGAQSSKTDLISFTSDNLQCKRSNVAVGEFDCQLNVGVGKITGGRQAHELYASLLEVGVEESGALGSAYLYASAISCQIKPKEIAQCGGGGGSCTLTYEVIE